MVDNLICCDTSDSCLRQIPDSEGVVTSRVIVEEQSLPFKDNTIDLVISSLSMHWINDLPKAFTQVWLNKSKS